MHTWIKRSLGTAAIAGGLVFAGATMASADDSTSSNQNATGSSFSSPITIGGIDAGATSERSSSSTSTVTRTDDRGRTTTDSRTSKDASKGSYGLSTKGITLDPSAITRSASTKSSSRDDSGRSAASSSDATSVRGSSPVKVGGITLTGTSERAASDSRTSTRTDEKGTRTSERSSESASKTGGTIGTRDITANPAGALTDRRSTTSSSDRIGDRGTSRSTSETAGDLSAPVKIGGAFADVTDERADKDARTETVTDENGTRSQTERNATASRTQGGLDVGSIAADPAGLLRDARTGSSSSDRLGDEDANTSSSRSALGLTAPVRAEGVSGGVSREDASARERESLVRDEDRTVRRTESQQSASREAFAGRSGAFTGAPALGLTDARSASSASDRFDDASTSASDTRGTYAFPSSYDGFAFGGDFARADARQVSEQVSDDFGTTTRTQTDESSQRTTPAYSFDGFRSAPSGDFSVQRTLAGMTSDF